MGHRIGGVDGSVTSGNALVDGLKNHGRGWFIGYFISPTEGSKCTKEIEVKWGVHRSGEEKKGIGKNNTSKTLCLLIRGRFTLIFPTRENVSLEKEGDYAIFGAEISHSWRADEDSVVLSIRWPSVPSDQTVI